MSAHPGVPSFMVACLEAQQAFTRLAGTALASDPAQSDAQQSFAELYRGLFAMPGLVAAGAETAATEASIGRYQRAAERVLSLLNEAALDAGRRLETELAADAPDLMPITSLRELRAVWIDCGEAAWSAAAHREEFAQAQAELLAAWATLRAAGRPG